jgi:hypothetical protein
MSLMVEGDISHDKRLPLARLHDAAGTTQGNGMPYIF